MGSSTVLETVHALRDNPSRLYVDVELVDSLLMSLEGPRPGTVACALSPALTKALLNASRYDELEYVLCITHAFATREDLRDLIGDTCTLRALACHITRFLNWPKTSKHTLATRPSRT